MNLHKHARLTPRGRALLVQRIVEHGLRVEEAAHASGAGHGNRRGLPARSVFPRGHSHQTR
ncbi:leucine zipper domain-containing protein [Xanthomonas oryzae]|uniref:leucine zipper domain-containing protein n=1 Tax=Xanthomonas oryzae TaxID=347 RepID=UPI00269B3344